MLNIRIVDLRDAGTCDLSGKSGEVVLAQLAQGENPVSIATSQLVKHLRFLRKRQATATPSARPGRVDGVQQESN